jgi:hypothetical protein
MAEEILKNIPEKMKWEITAKTLTSALAALDPILAPIMGKDTWREINDNLFAEGAKIAFPQIKEAFNIQVEDAIGATNLAKVVATLQMGPEFEWENIEESPERVIWRVTKCPWWNRYDELELKPEFRVCETGSTAWGEAGFRVINPKITFKHTKSMPRGDPYCEHVIEFKK